MWCSIKIHVKTQQQSSNYTWEKAKISTPHISKTRQLTSDLARQMNSTTGKKCVFDLGVNCTFKFQHQTMMNRMTKNQTNDMALSEWIYGLLRLPVKVVIMKLYVYVERDSLKFWISSLSYCKLDEKINTTHSFTINKEPNSDGNCSGSKFLIHFLHRCFRNSLYK